MTDVPYTKRVSFLFSVGKLHWEVTSFDAERIAIEETRKNGQEDEHIGGDLVRTDGRWTLTKWLRESIETHEADADAIEAFFNQHGAPAPPPKPVVLSSMERLVGLFTALSSDEAVDEDEFQSVLADGRAVLASLQEAP